MLEVYLLNFIDKNSEILLDHSFSGKGHFNENLKSQLDSRNPSQKQGHKEQKQHRIDGNGHISGISVIDSQNISLSCSKMEFGRCCSNLCLLAEKTISKSEIEQLTVERNESKEKFIQTDEDSNVTITQRYDDSERNLPKTLMKPNVVICKTETEKQLEMNTSLNLVIDTKYSTKSGVDINKNQSKSESHTHTVSSRPGYTSNRILTEEVKHARKGAKMNVNKLPPNGGSWKTSTSESHYIRILMDHWRGFWITARMLLLASIWSLRMLSGKPLLMTVLINAFSSPLLSTWGVAADNAKSNEKGVTLPVFLEPIPNVTVAVGREASLTCTVDHLGKHKVAWIHLDRQMILSIHNHVITRTPRFSVTHDSHKTWTLHVTNVKEEDRGHYMCQVNTKPMISQTGFIQVVVPPNIMDELSSQSSIVVQEKDEVTLSCHGEGFPVPQIKWRREDGKTMDTPSGRKVDQLEGSNLPLQQVSRMDMGAYLCIATNGVPPSVSKRITLAVEFAPEVHVPNQLMSAPLGSDIHLHCYVEAHPQPITYWEFSNAMVVNTPRITTEIIGDHYKIHMQLTIRELRDGDFGTYKCISKNSIAATDGSISLNKIFRSTSAPQKMLHSSDDESRSHSTQGRGGTDKQRNQLEASKRRYQEEEETDRRMEEEARMRSLDPDIGIYDREPNLGYRDENNNRINHPPSDNGGTKYSPVARVIFLGILRAVHLL